MSRIEAFQRGQLLVIPEGRLAFCMTPKVANTSMRFALHYAFGLEDADRKVTTKRYRYSVNPRPVDPDYLRVIFVRSPWDRLRSCYTDKILRSSPESLRADLKRMGCQSQMPFDEFVERVCDTPDEELDKHLLPQYHLVLSPLWGGRPDLLLRYERLEQDWQRLRVLVGALPPRLEYRNASKRPKPAWTPRLAELVYRRFRADVELGYHGAHPC